MKRMIAAALTVMMGIGAVAPAALARANEKRAHNVAIGTTAAAAYLLSKHKTRGLGVVAAGGAAYAWKKHHDAVKQRHNIQKRRASSYYRSRYTSSRYTNPRYRTTVKSKNANYKNGYYRNHKNGYYRNGKWVRAAKR